MWRSSRLLAAVCIWIAGAVAPATAGPRVCLPPVFDGGQRLFSLPSPSVFWLELLLRQHELCWRTPRTADERRILLIGNSAVYGFPIDVDDTLAARLNRGFAAAGVPAHVFNLGFVNSYQVRDAVILHEALAYQPDLIVYPLTLADFQHTAPMRYETVIEFFRANRRAFTAFREEGVPPGLEEPFERYRRSLADPREVRLRRTALRETGGLIRTAVREHAYAVAASLEGASPRRAPPPDAPRGDYDCSATELAQRRDFTNWKQWNILLYLAKLQRSLGIRVLVVNWPVAHEPVGVCYNRRYAELALADFNQWLASETAARGLRYLDLQRLLPNEDFFDSVHVDAAGHARIAAAIEPVLADMVRSSPPPRR